MIYCPTSGKECFPTRGAALHAARNMKHRHKGLPSVYHCQTCDSWHLTHFSYRWCHEFACKAANPKKRNDMKIIINTAFNDDVEVTIQTTKEDEPQRLIGIVITDRITRRATALTYDQALELVEALKIQIAKL